VNRHRRLDGVLVALDWNGTVMCDLHRAVAATNAVLSRRGREPLSHGRFRANFTLPLQKWLRDLGVADDEVAEREWNAAMAATGARPRDGAIEALTAMRQQGARTTVVSAASRFAVVTDLDAGGMTGLFDRVDTGVIDKASHLAKLRNAHRRALYVGDTEYDVEAAQLAGYEAVAITGGYRPAAALRASAASAVVDSFAQVIGLLESQEAECDVITQIRGNIGDRCVRTRR